ncbi:hypothetical protein [Flavobacterium sp.]|uniref:hypothetical protein n=1 Tax=Flavobacterium sp. TaxID=239 RepID=UPI002FD956D9
MRFLSILLLVSTLASFAQEKKGILDWDYKPPVYSPFNPQAAENTYAIKAKALPFFLGNGFGIYNSLGFEAGFCKNNSVAIDGFYNYSQDTEDEVTDRQGIKHETGNRSYMFEKAVQLSYRHYYSFQKWREHYRLTFYNGVFFRTEHGRNKKDENYNNEYITRTANTKAFGLVTGMVQRFQDSSHFGMDYNFSLGKKFESVDKYKLVNTNYITTNTKSNSFYFNIGISVNYWF